MSKPAVFVSRSVHPSVLQRLESACEVRAWTGKGRCPADAMLKEIQDVEAVIGTDSWSDELMGRAPRLRHIALTSVGFDMVDLDAANRRGILVTNTAGSLTETVADLVYALMLAAARRVCEMERWMRAGQWREVGVTPMGRDLHHATLGILGFGRIGVAVAERARGFRMTVLYHDVVRRADLEQQHGYRFVEKEALFREADFLTVHTVLTDETRKLVGAAELGLMKPTAFLINTSRGPVVDEQALIAALAEERIAGAALDVFEKEPVDLSNPLLAMENVVKLPHVGSATEATRRAMVDLAVENALAVCQGRPPLTPVNPEVLSRLRPR
jgi:lactate dehydrogenase-like 2-hydroxyacid dehydrogenase